MSLFTTVIPLPLRSGPSDDSARVRPADVRAGAIVEVIAPPPGVVVGDWRHVRLQSTGETGYLPGPLLERLVMSEERDLTPEERRQFAGFLTEASRLLGADRDYLLALAHSESRINNVESASSSCFGPFQFLQATWDGYIDGVASTSGLTKADWRDWTKQPVMAAIAFAEDLRRLTEALGRTPLLAEMHFSHWAGGAVDAPLLNGDRTRPYVDAHAALQPDRAQAVLKANRSVVEGRSVQEVVDELGRRLDQSWEAVQPLIDDLPAHYRTTFDVADSTPWMGVAEQELRNGVAEISGAKSETRIDEYHEIGGGARELDSVPWCGSFVAFCLVTCGDAEAAASVIAGPKRAANWTTWGVPAPVGTGSERRGDVIVLRPQAAGSSGHVGFLAAETATHVTLLGGNQDDAVSLQSYALEEVSERRTLR